MIQKSKRSLGLVIVALVLLVFCPAIHAQQPNQLIVTPAFVNVELSDANKLQKTQIAITNTYASNIELTASLKGIDEIGGKLVPAGDVNPTLGQAIQLSKTEFVAIAKDTTILEVDILNIPSLPTGGHYASLVLSQKPKPGQQSSYTSQISISVFIVKVGGERKSIEARLTSSNQHVFRIPSSVKVEFKNTGNTHVTPRASVLVTNNKGQLVAKGVANTGSQPLLPNKSISSAVNLKSTRFLWLPQKLTQTISYRVDGSNAYKNQQSHFWYIPPVFIALLLLLPVMLYVVFRVTKRIIKNRKHYSAKIKAIKPKKQKKSIKPQPNEELALAVASEFEPSEKDVLAVHVELKKSNKPTAKSKPKKLTKNKKPAGKKKTQKPKKNT